MTKNSKEAVTIIAIVMALAFLYVGVPLVADMWTDKKQKRTGFICMFISALIEIGLYFLVFDKKEVNMSSSLQTKLLLASFLTLYIITIVSIMGIALYSGVYTYTTEEKTIPTVDFISISTNKNNFIIKYKNQKGNKKTETIR